MNIYKEKAREVKCKHILNELILAQQTLHPEDSVEQTSLRILELIPLMDDKAWGLISKKAGHPPKVGPEVRQMVIDVLQILGSGPERVRDRLAGGQ